MGVTATPAELLHRAVRRDGSRPLLTFYDDATGERVELSTTTFDNWVAKTAGLLTDGLDVEPGTRVALLLPAHWQALVWACACWSVGACVVPGVVSGPDGGVSGRDADAQVVVAGPDVIDAATLAGLRADSLVGLSLRPLGGRFTDPLPAGVLDYAAEVPVYPDRFVPITPPEPDEPALDHDGVVHTLAGLVARAGQRAEQVDATAGGRLLISGDDLPTALVDALLVPLAIGGSAVLVRHENRPGRDARIAAERVTAVIEPPSV